MAHPFANSILIFLAIISYGTSTEWNGFLGKFTSSFFGSNGFYDMPLTTKEALESSPAYYDTELQDPEFNVKIYCLKNDPHVCPMFDVNGRIAGLLISHIQSELSNNAANFPYDFGKIPTFSNRTMLGYQVWSAQFLFTKPENLKKGGQGKDTKDETADGLWVRLTEGWTEIPRDECEAQTKGWNKQGFIPWMGNHYSMGQLDDCSTYLPLLPIYHKGRLIALSFAPLGDSNVITRDWFEDVPSSSVKKIVPNGYKTCLEEWVKKYKSRSFHFYFVKHPRFILWNQSASC